MVFSLLIFGSRWNYVSAQVRFYLDYTNTPFGEGGSNDFRILTGFKLDPNKEVLIGIGLRGRFNPNNLQGDLRFSQSSFSLGYNHYYSRRLYFNTDISFSLINKVLSDARDPVNLEKDFYLNYKVNVTFVTLRRLHFSTGMSIIDFSNLLNDLSKTILTLDPSRVNLVFALRLYLFQIKT